MKLSSLILLIILVTSKCIKFDLELQKNVLKFGYGINYKYEGMLTHSFDRFYIITNFILPSIGDIRFSHLNFDDSCSYMNKEYAPNMDSNKYLKELKTYCNKLKPFVSYYFKLIKSYNNTVYDILENKIIVKHKSSYSCESAIYFNLMTDIIRDNCNFDFYHNKSDIIPTILDRGNKIILANWPNDKHIICNINNDIPVKIPSHPYVLVDRGILCNCGLDADNHYLLESLAACRNKHTKLKVYFTINLAFTNYLDEMPNLTDQSPIDRGITEYEQILPIHLNVSSTSFDSSLHPWPSRLKDFVHKHMQGDNVQEIFDLQKRHTLHTSLPYKNFFSNKIVNIFTFTSSIISMITIILVICLYCKHKHIRTIIASLILHKVKEVEANTPTKPENTECQTLAYIGITLTLLSMMIVVLLHYRRSKFCRGYRFSNVEKIVLFISDVQHYIPVKLTKTSGSPHLFKFTGTLNSEDIKLNKNYLWDTLEINWDKIKLTFNDSEIKLPQLVTIKMQDKIRIRRMMSKDMQSSHIMIKQRITWYYPEAEIRTI